MQNMGVPMRAPEFKGDSKCHKCLKLGFLEPQNGHLEEYFDIL